ncbi:hypothetical protein BDC45DRAFT_542618 [Circinella umbellata]|nr:hypothetical protein BDC45DRAFT_542618 [Circinella umbellata]
MQTASEIYYGIKKCFCNQCFQMSTRPEKYIHQKKVPKIVISVIIAQNFIKNGLRIKAMSSVLHLIRHPLIRSASASASSDADGCIIRSDDAVIRKIESGNGFFYRCL